MPPTKPLLGLVCITSTDAIRFRTVTRTRLRLLDPAAQRTKLTDLYTENIRRLAAAIEFCHARAIALYRMSSSMFPFAEEPPGYEILGAMSERLAVIGRRANELGVRLVMHPDQFVVLSSDSSQVIANSISILAHQARVLDLLEQPRSPWAAIQLHGGKGARARTLVSVIRDLPEPVRSRLALENDEFAYSADEILAVCDEAGVPMVFDAHHHLCHAALESYDDVSVERHVRASRSTWPETRWQIAHISNGRSRLQDPRHADFITAMPAAYRRVPWIEVEAKQKEEAIAALQAWWP